MNAKDFAIERHADQTYSNGKPYSYHLGLVEDVLKDFGFTQEFWINCAWLHDTLEDTPTTKEELEREFGSEVADTVFKVSGFGANRKARMADICSKVKGSWPAATLKIADRIVNVEECVKSKYGPMYLKEREQFAAAVYHWVIHAGMIDRLEAAYGKIANE